MRKSRRPATWPNRATIWEVFGEAGRCKALGNGVTAVQRQSPDARAEGFVSSGDGQDYELQDGAVDIAERQIRCRDNGGRLVYFRDNKM